MSLVRFRVWAPLKAASQEAAFLFSVILMIKKQIFSSRVNGRSNNNNTPLTEAVERFNREDRVSFHVPGHKSRGIISEMRNSFGEDVLRMDLTELPGLDDLHHPSGVIAEAERYAAEVFGAEETFFLVNGTSGGITAAIAAVVSEENTLILERYSHECATRGLILSGAVPYYINNYYDEETGLFTGISPSDAEHAISHCFSPAAI